MVSCRSGVRQKHFPFSPLVLVNRQLPSPTQTCPNALTVSRRLCVFVSVRLSVCLFLCMSSSMNHHFGFTSISLYLCLYLAVSLSRYLVWLISFCLFFLFRPFVSLHLLCPLWNHLQFVRLHSLRLQPQLFQEHQLHRPRLPPHPTRSSEAAPLGPRVLAPSVANCTRIRPTPGRVQQTASPFVPTPHARTPAARACTRVRPMLGPTRWLAG